MFSERIFFHKTNIIFFFFFLLIDIGISTRWWSRITGHLDETLPIKCSLYSLSTLILFGYQAWKVLDEKLRQLNEN